MTTEEALKKIEPYVITKGGRELGVLSEDLEEYILTPAEFKKFNEWMSGQTVGVIADTVFTVSVIYTDDVVRFLTGKPVID